MTILERINALEAALHAALGGDDALKTEAQLEAFRLEFLSKNGALKSLEAALKDCPPAEKGPAFKAYSPLKKQAEERFEAAKEALEAQLADGPIPDDDLTLPPPMRYPGARHPISIVRSEMIEIFKRMGFTVSKGPEVVDDWHNFTALNFPEDHPARDMQDTFFLANTASEGGEDAAPAHLLRTHTSTVQVKLMQSSQPPIRSIMPGRVYRNETISARAHCNFHQVEGLYVDTDVSMADLKQTLFQFVREFFGTEIEVRYRPSYFPFTEPSAEMDISCQICFGSGCNVCKHTGWVEILGCGMVDPAVLTSCGIDAQKYTGFAFGMGIERVAMLRYNIKDLRLFYENDVRFLQQFATLQ